MSSQNCNLSPNVQILKKGPGPGINNLGKFSFNSNSAEDFPPLPSADESAYENYACKQEKADVGTSAATRNASIKHELDNSFGTGKVRNESKSVRSNRDVKIISQPEIGNGNKEQNVDSSLVQRSKSENVLTSKSMPNMSTVQRLSKANRRKGKKQNCQHGDKITLVTPEMHRILSGEQTASISNPRDLDINSKEEYPELSSVENASLTADVKSNNELLETKRRGKLKASKRSGVSVISRSGSMLKSSSYCSSYNWVPTRSFSDILKTTTVPASSLKFRKSSTLKETTAQNDPTNLLETNSTGKDANESISSTQSNATKKEAISRDKSKLDRKIQKKVPSAALNLADFLASVSSGKVKKKREKFKSLDRKRNVLTPHNALDSTAPIRKRGKERELPKKKHLSTLKKIILRERQLRKAILNETVLGSNISEAKENFSDELVSDSPVVDHVKLQCGNDELDCKKDLQDFTVDDSTVERGAKMQENNPGENKKWKIVKQMLHTRAFREYCDQMISPDIDNLLSSLLRELVRFQDRLHQKDPTKAKTKKRMVCGLKEVTKHLKMKKVKVLVIAPDVERIHSEGGLDDMLTNILKVSSECGVSCVFGLGRRKMGSILKKKAPVSCVGIFNYEGTEEIFKQLMEKVNEARSAYKKCFESISDFLKPELIDSLQETISVKEKQELWKKISDDPTVNLDYCSSGITKKQTEE